MKKGLQLRSGERGQYRKRKRDEGQRLLRLFDKPQEIILSYLPKINYIQYIYKS